MEWNIINNIKSKAFHDSGWYVMRSDRDYCMISCGKNGQNGYGGHAHNDKLSIVVCLNGNDIFVDPGTYLYTSKPQDRNIFRSTAYHNTVWIDGLEQNRWPKGNLGLFRLYEDANPQVLVWESTDSKDRFVGEHYGFKHKGMIHRREVEFLKNKRTEIFIKDWLKSNVTFLGAAHFHLPPRIRVVHQGKNIYTISSVQIVFQNAERIVISEYSYSQEYGVKEKAQVIKVFFHNNLITKIRKIDG